MVKHLVRQKLKEIVKAIQMEIPKDLQKLKDSVMGSLKDLH